jgi:hypothetical protein
MIRSGILLVPTVAECSALGNMVIVLVPATVIKPHPPLFILTHVEQNHGCPHSIAILN